MGKASSVGGAVLVAVALTSASAIAFPYQGPGYRLGNGPGCGPPGTRGWCDVPYRGPGNGPPGYYGYGGYQRPYAGPGNGPPGYYRRYYRQRYYYRD